YLSFIMDSCHSGRGVQVARKERHNALTNAALQHGTRGEKARAAVMVFVQYTRQLLLELRGSSGEPRHFETKYRWMMPGDDNGDKDSEYLGPVSISKQIGPRLGESPTSNNYWLSRAIGDIWRERYMPVLTILAQA